MIKPVLGSDLLGELLSRNACLAVSVTRSHLILDSGLNGKPSNEQGVAWRISLSTGAPWYFRRGVLSRGGLRIILGFIYL